MSVLKKPEFPPHLECLKRVDALLRCPMCCDYLNISTMTKCSHNFCSLCIRKVLTYRQQCPVCNQDMTELDLKKNRILDDLVVNFKAASQQLMKNMGSPSVSPETLLPTVKRKALKPCLSMVESTIMKNFLQKGDSPSSSSSSHRKRPRPQPPCTTNNLRQDQFKIRAVKVELVPLPIQMTRTLKEERVKVPSEVTRTMNEGRMKDSAPVLRTVKEEKVEVPVLLTRAVKDERVEVPVRMSRTVKEGRVAMPEQGTRTVKKEMVDEPAMDSSGLTSSSESPSTSQSMKAVVKVECPVCTVGIPEPQINSHLDSCLNRDEKKESLRSSANKRKPITKLVYSLMTVQELRKRLRDLRLPTQGSRQQLVRRHQEYVLMYNAECDSFSPKSAEDIAKEVQVNEKMRSQLHFKTKIVIAFSKNQTEEEIDRLHLNYRKQHSAEFSLLVDQVRGHWEASKKARVEEVLERGAVNTAELSDAASRLSRVSEEPAEERLLDAEASERPPSPALSDISVSSSISDVFSSVRA